MTTSTHNTPGILMGFSAYALWGFFPLYFYFLSEVSSTEVLAHRVVWSVATLLLLLWWQGRHRSVFASLRSKKRAAALAFASLMITGNWLIYIYAIATERTIDASMGYFINPIFLIVLGLVFFKERLNRYQLICLLLAGVGIAYQWVALGGFSWISLSLPVLFGLYGVVKKNLKLDSVSSLFLETFIALPVAAVYLIVLGVQGNMALLTDTPLIQVLLIGAGAVTTLPLLLFAGGARRLPLNTMGFLQYITPSLQFAIGLFVFGEALNPHNLVAFLFVWTGLLVLVVG
ncbi:MAG: EamA family transporter RarD, partial [Candidatus Hydrogenedentes bacterium]|nr:EamA family transporter RarD [Candidatus Hydrogenedentota bacterium]